MIVSVLRRHGEAELIAIDFLHRSYAMFEGLLSSASSGLKHLRGSWRGPTAAARKDNSGLIKQKKQQPDTREVSQIGGAGASPNSVPRNARSLRTPREPGIDDNVQTQQEPTLLSPKEPRPSLSVGVVGETQQQSSSGKIGFGGRRIEKPFIHKINDNRISFGDLA